MINDVLERKISPYLCGGGGFPQRRENRLSNMTLLDRLMISNTFVVSLNPKAKFFFCVMLDQHTQANFRTQMKSTRVFSVKMYNTVTIISCSG